VDQKEAIVNQSSSNARKSSGRIDLRIHAMEAEREFHRLLSLIDDIESDKAFNYVVWLREEMSGASRSDLFAGKLRGLQRFARRLERESREDHLELLRAAIAIRARRTHAAVASAVGQAGELGHRTHRDVVALSRQGQRALEEQLDFLESNPCHAALRETLYLVDDYLVLVDPGLIERALDLLAAAARALYVEAEKRFRARPGIDRFEELLRSSIVCRTLGDPVAPAREGWSPAEPGTLHRLASGENLARVSELYYGAPQFWDVIFLENARAIGERVHDPGVGLELVIP